MCTTAIVQGRLATNQGELSKLLGHGDWKRGKKLVVIGDEYEQGYQFDACLCPVDFIKTAANAGLEAVYDGIDWELK